MKPLTATEMFNLYCGLFATADALRKLHDTEGRAEWCDAMGKMVKAKFHETDSGSPFPLEQVEENKKWYPHD
jgi:hypothetical protein